MKVAFVLGTSTGGTARHVKMLAAGCAARGVQTAVLGPAQTDRDFAFGAGFTPVEIADRPRLARDLRAIARLRRLLRSSRPDLVHAHGLRAGALSAIAVAFAAPRHPAARPALVVTVHNAPPAAGTAGVIYRVLELIVARNARLVLCVSGDLEDRMRAAGARQIGRAIVPAPAISLTPPDVSLTPPDVSLTAPDVSAETRAATRAGLGAGPDQPVVLAVGRLAAQKGFGLLLEAASRWRDLTPEPLLVIAGEGPLRAELAAQAAALGVAVNFTGQRQDVSALLVAADVFVLPSVWEGQALILQEALRAGMAIVATRVGGNPDLAGHDAALLVPPGDAGRLSDAVRAVLSDPALAARLRQAAADQAGALPGEDEAVDAVLAGYRKITS